MRRKGVRIAAFLLLAVIGSAAGWYLLQNRRQPEPQKAVQAAADPYISAVAKIQAPNVVPVPVPVTGTIEVFHAEPGQEVYEGQLLARIKSETLEGIQEGAELAAEGAQTKVDNLEYSLTSERLEASRAQADAVRARSEFDRLQREYERQKMLLAEGATPRKTFEKTEKEFQQAKIEAESLQAIAKNAASGVEKLQNDLEIAKKTLEARNEDLEEAKQQVTAGDVVSPVNGLVTARRGQPGEQVNPSIRDLFRIATDLSLLEAIADISPDVLSRIQPGQPVLVNIAELPGEQLEGQVKRIENGQAIVEFRNPSPDVRPGVTAQVTIMTK